MGTGICIACNISLNTPGTPKFCPMCGQPFATPALEALEPPARIVPADRPVVDGEVIGWRAWDVVKLGKLVRLGSVTAKSHWRTSNWTQARCPQSGGGPTCLKSSDGRCRGENCHCGLYSARDFEHLTAHLPYAQYRNGEDKIIGQIALAGKVIEGSQGYRAERARIVRIYVPQTNWKLGRTIATQYGVEYETLRWVG